MTEDEAKGNWCPFVRMVTGKIEQGQTRHANQPTYNRIVDGEAYAWPRAGGCIASACMAWRWTDYPRDMTDPAKPTRFNGYCGLAGPT